MEEQTTPQEVQQEETVQPEQVESNETTTEVQQPTEETQAETQEPQIEEHEQHAELPTEANSEEQPQQEVQEPVQEETFEIPTVPQVRPLTSEDIVVNPETNEVDVKALLDTFNNRIDEAVQVATTQSVTSVELKNKYEKAWADAEAAYPELKEDKSLRDMVYAVHADTVQQGKKYLSPKAAAEKLLSIREKGKTEGIQAANESVRIQESAQLETGNQSAAPTVDSNLQERLNSSDPQVAEKARQEHLAKLIKSGKI